MTLSRVKNALYCTKFGEDCTDGMVCSEPILSLENGVLTDHFFVYMTSLLGDQISGPVARLALQADQVILTAYISCHVQPFSVGPTALMKDDRPTPTQADYENYSRLYQQLRTFAFQTNCSAPQKQIISAYLQALKTIVSSTQYPLYEEMRPDFFAWARAESI